MQTLRKPRLDAMMFPEVVIWGGCFVTMGTCLATTLGAGGAEIGSACSTQSWGTNVAPSVFGLAATGTLGLQGGHPGTPARRNLRIRALR